MRILSQAPVTTRIAALGLLALLAAAPARAAPCGEGDVGDIDTSCPGLWHERNRVLAEHGFCFKTPRALRAFGRACFPPYGHLSDADRCYVAALQTMERQQGCAAE